MDLNEFSIVLPSNSSMDYFPHNTTTNFSTKLPRPIELHGKWQVGISEIHVPCTTLHLRREDTKIVSTMSREDKEDEIYFQHGIYDSIHTLVQTINEELFKYHNNTVCEKIFYDEKGGYVSIREYVCKDDEKRKTIALSPAVKRILGFEDGGILKVVPKGEANISSSSSEKKFMLVGKQPASLARGIPDQLFIYSNLSEPCIVGDTFAPLLKIVNIDAKHFNFGSTIVKRFAPIGYSPLLNHRFQTIDIDIRDQYGNPIAFEFGTLTVTVHFRRDF